MNYPFWDTSVGYGLLMGCISVVHVFISHFAIGGGLYLVINEMIARKYNNQPHLDFLKKLSKFFVLLTLVMGALTGVGIWFIIGLLNPAATEVLIHNFVWAWASEWTFFITEIAAALFYFYGWEKMSAKNHIVIGWIYFISAWMSLFIINGIITFMLTPGEWITTGNFWDGFFNPTFWPSLVFRTGISVMLAGFYALLIASRHPADQFKAHLVRINAGWGLIGLALMVPSFYWYWRAIPQDITTNALAMMSIPLEAINQGVWYAGVVAMLLILFGFIQPRRLSLGIALLILFCGFMIFSKFEWFRESIRKPYVIGNYMYGNAVDVSQTPVYKQDGYLKHMTYRTGNDGADLFRRACRSCHTLTGYRPLQEAFDGMDEAFIQAIVKGIHALKGNMPPFFGTDEEADLLAKYLYQQTDKRPLKEITQLEGVALGEKVYDRRCGKCHVRGGYHDKTSSIIGFASMGYETMLDSADNFGDEMPAFTGNEIERLALIEFLKTFKEGQ